jgi:dienelactone hydrolase
VEVDTDIADFSRRDITLLGKTKPVLLTGATGPAVIVIHEVYGFTPTLARFCRWVRDAGFRVYAPILFGSPDAGNTEKQTLGRVLSLFEYRLDLGQALGRGVGARTFVL